MPHDHRAPNAGMARSRRSPRRRTPAVVVSTAIAAVAAVGLAAPGTNALFSGAVQAPASIGSATLPQPTVVTSHPTVNNGLVTVTWSSAATFATGYLVQRATSSGGPFSTVATITLGTSGFAEFAVPTSASQPGGIAAGPDGNVWFTEVAGNKIGKVTPSGTVTEYTVPTSSSQPTDIVAGTDGNLWFTEFNANKVAKITTSGTITEYTLTTANSQPRGITVGADGNLWVASSNAGKIAKVTTAGVVTEYSAGTGAKPYDIATGPDEYLYYTDNVNSKVWYISPTGTGAFGASTPTATSSPKGITPGPFGAVRFAESAASKDKIGKYPTYGDSLSMSDTGTGITASSAPTGVASGSDGNLWFTELSGNRIAHMDGSNNVTELSVPTSSSQPTSIVAGPDGNMWFTEANGNKIGRYGMNLSNSWVDTTAEFGTQYHYQVLATYNSWTRTSAAQASLSLAPTSGTDATAASPAAISAANLTNLSLADTFVHTNSTNWTQDSYTASNLNGVSMLNATTGWTVGAGGTILKTTDAGLTWSAQTSNTAQNLNYVWVLDSTHVWAVGQAGTVVFYNGTSWATQTSNTAANLNGVWAKDSTHVWAVGASGVVDFYNGTSWATQTSNTATNLNAVHGVDSTHVWAVGDSGVVDVYNGTLWATQTSNTVAKLKDVRAVDATHVWAGGDGQVIDFYNGSSWATQSTGAGALNIHGLAFTDTTHGWAAAKGAFFVWNGSTWSAQSTTANYVGQYESIWATGPADLVAVGATGQISITGTAGAEWLAVSTQYVEYQFTASPLAGSVITSVEATVVVKPGAAPGASLFWLFASGDGGASWDLYPLTSPGAAATITDTVDITSTIGTATKVGNLRLRFFVDAASAFKTSTDLVQVQVN